MASVRLLAMRTPGGRSVWFWVVVTTIAGTAWGKFKEFSSTAPNEKARQEETKDMVGKSHVIHGAVKGFLAPFLIPVIGAYMCCYYEEEGQKK